MGNKDDPRFTRFVRALSEWWAQHADDEPKETEFKTLDEYVDEAERHYWATRGDPATEADRVRREARRQHTTHQHTTTDDQ